MPPFNFWTLAQWLIENKKCAEGFRSSVSRSYYSAFHTAHAFLTRMGIAIPSKDKHVLVPDVLMYSGDAGLEGIGKKLDNLKTERNHADYDLGDADYESEENAILRLREAASIIAGINSCEADKIRYEQAKIGAIKRANLRIAGK